MLNLERLRSDAVAYLEQHGMVVFKSQPHKNDMACDDVLWDQQAHPDFREFVAAAEAVGVRMVTVAGVEFQAEILEGALDHLRSSGLDRDARWAFEARLEEMRRYDGLLCELELAFFHAGRTYVFRQPTEWWEELNELLEEVEDAQQPADDSPLGGYYSKN